MIASLGTNLPPPNNTQMVAHLEVHFVLPMDEDAK